MPCKHALEVTIEQLEWIASQDMFGKNDLSTEARKVLYSLPKTIKIGNHEIPEPMREKPEIGRDYYFISASEKDGVMSSSWRDTETDNFRFNHMVCHLTRDNCIAHAEALFSFSEVG